MPESIASHLKHLPFPGYDNRCQNRPHYHRGLYHLNSTRAHCRSQLVCRQSLSRVLAIFLLDSPGGLQ